MVIGPYGTERISVTYVIVQADAGGGQERDATVTNGSRRPYRTLRQALGIADDRKERVDVGIDPYG